ncbi:MCE family protein [Nocardioides marmoriginsengisoli]|uniref:MCE family protein n=1 Tax=Nocardioides marmoriginsengisoli TaxID=661483 RepID=A0A3N0CH68_9ACTN|nr:MCE family protein [Nocardioides marmoriginsengisoli]RNL62790.1 MCE family protein [Nocardioides marmoriginsengisoli]
MPGAPKRTLQERNQAALGLIGLAVMLLIMVCALNVNAIRSVFGETTFEAAFVDAGGVRSGDDVRVDGVSVGSVKSVELDGKHVKVTFRAGDVRLGNKTTVAVRSDNALGSKYLAVEPAGSGSETTVPVQRTDPGVAVSEVLGKLTANNEQIDTKRLAASFESMTKVLDATPKEFASALEGVSALSETISSRDAELEQLLQRASSISGVLADRNEQLLAIMSNGTALFREINQRRDAISVLFTEVRHGAKQFAGLATDSKGTLSPNLAKINKLAKTLADYRDDLSYVLTTFPRYARSLGEAVGSGPFFQAYVANLFAPETLANTDNVVKSILDPSYNGAVN